mmetsp:Transcript_30136/g.53475  ORF Transcript_30136/g.53475 Transcript_30136/m.53475 type:complete len:89 (+) Transcript_30136:3-269(+)
MDFYCKEGGLMDKAAGMIRKAANREDIDQASLLLKAAMNDINALTDISPALIPHGESSPVSESAIRRCSGKLSALRSADFRVPFDPFA